MRDPEYDLRLEYSSVFELGELLRKSSRIEYNYHKALAEAIKIQEKLQLKLNITTSTIIKELCDNYGKAVPVTAKQEMRKADVFLDPRYQEVANELIEATAIASKLKGVTYSFKNRSDRMRELVSLVHREFKSDTIISKSPNQTVNEQIDNAMQYSDY